MRMITGGCIILTLLVSSVHAHPVAPEPAEEEDLEVMKCIVEVIADMLTKPRPVTISQECWDTLTEDDRIVSILRHRNFLKELQEVAAQGGQEPHFLQGDEGAGQRDKRVKSDHGDQITTGSVLTANATTEVKEGQEEQEEEDEEKLGGRWARTKLIQKVPQAEEQVQGNEIPQNRVSVSHEDDSQEQQDKEEEKPSGKLSPLEARRGNEMGEEESSEQVNEGEQEVGKQDSQEELLVEDGPQEKRAGVNSGMQEQEEPKYPAEDAGQGRETNELLAPEKGGEAEVGLKLKSSEAGEQFMQADEPTTALRSPESQESKTEAQGQEVEEGSGSRKPEDNEIERLAAIETELEGVARRLHQLRRG